MNFEREKIEDMLKAWENINVEDVKSIIITDNIPFATYKEGEILQLDEPLDNKRMKVAIVGGVFVHPKYDERINENRVLFKPYELQ